MIEPWERPIMFELTQTAELHHRRGDAGDDAWAAFLADVKRFAAKGAPASSPTATAAPMATRKSLEPILAVLAFDNLSANSELQFFSDGVAEEILSVIARAPGIKVIGSNSRFSFRGERKKDAARPLGVSHVLDGPVRRSGPRARISAELT